MQVPIAVKLPMVDTRPKHAVLIALLGGLITSSLCHPWSQVTDCLAEAKRAGADVLRNPLRTPAHAASRAPVLERRSDDAPELRALAARAAVQDSGRAARVQTLSHHPAADVGS